jgi:hypothetical protein
MQGGGKNHRHSITTGLGGDCLTKAMTDGRSSHAGLAGDMPAITHSSAMQVLRVVSGMLKRAC